MGDRAALASSLAGRRWPRRTIHVGALDVLLLRVNPLDPTMLTFAMLAEAAGVRVRNAPSGVLRTSHKSWLAGLPDVPTPRTLVTRSPSAAARFAAESPTGVVVKPARACGGKGVGRVLPGRGRQAALERAFEEALAAGDGYAVLQVYLPEAEAGEKRLLWLDGALVGGYLRMRAPGEWRHNLKTGGVPTAARLTARDEALAAALTPHLRACDTWFAGLDVIGEHVVEVNTLNPGGAHYTEHFSGRDIAADLVCSLEPA
jgi:glutathione synthase